jgi:hypothetical protein
MYKQHLLNAIVKEMKICKRLYTKIPTDKMDFKSKEELRSIHELLQYLCIIGTAPLDYWVNKSETPFNAFFAEVTAASKQIHHEQFLSIMDGQIEITNKLFDQINEDDLFNKEVIYPWGEKAPFGEAIISTCIKFLSAYKLQLFLHIKLCSDQKLGTADAWVLTALD